MKILHLITTIERGGAEKAVLALAIAQEKCGHEVTVAPLKGEPELETTLREHGIKVLTQLRGKHPLIQIFRLRRMRFDYDIFHVHLPRAELVACSALGRGKFVITRHNSEPFFPGVSGFLSSNLSRYVTKSAVVIAISNAVLTFVLVNEELHPSCRYEVVYYGYAPKREVNLKKARTNLVNRKIHIGTISRLVPQKNLTLLLQFTENLIQHGLNIETSIVGVGPLDRVLKKQAKDAGIEKSVNFLGKTDQISEFLQGLDFFILTSTYEGFGLVLLEAIDSSVPIIASNVSSIPEVLGLDHPGLFDVSSRESFFKVFHNLSSSQRLRARTLKLQCERLKLFTIDNYVNEHDKVYNRFRREKSTPG